MPFISPHSDELVRLFSCRCLSPVKTFSWDEINILVTTLAPRTPAVYPRRWFAFCRTKALAPTTQIGLTQILTAPPWDRDATVHPRQQGCAKRGVRGGTVAISNWCKADVKENWAAVEGSDISEGKNNSIDADQRALNIYMSCLRRRDVDVHDCAGRKRCFSI